MFVFLDGMGGGCKIRYSQHIVNFFYSKVFILWILVLAEFTFCKSAYNLCKKL